tara:strand:+ start:858 stop:1325 length:468 start_codon:yes stop_codon:yes gene_type:complete
MVNYNNSMIYKLCCKDLSVTDVYVGSTTNFTRRKTQHRHNSNSSPKYKEHDYKVYKFIRANGGWENWDMVLIKNVSCDNVLELHKIERTYYENLNATLNKQVPSRSSKEWRYVNKEIVAGKQNKMFLCKCGQLTNKHNIRRHEKSAKHIMFKGEP